MAEAARNVVCVGAKPIAVTNCLNFASPERSAVMWSFSEVIDGMKEACETFGTPVVSGNVSFYNETDGSGILPTPVIGMIGLVDDVRKLVTQGFKNEGDIVAMLGTTKDDLEMSEYAQTVLGYTTDELIGNAKVPRLDLALEKTVQDACVKLIDEMLLNSAHDCSDGGLAVAIAESCFSSLNREAIGAEIELKDDGLPGEAVLFSESPSRIVISFAPEKLSDVEAIAKQFNCPFAVIGKVSGGTLNIRLEGKDAISVSAAELESVWKNSLEKKLAN